VRSTAALILLIVGCQGEKVSEPSDAASADSSEVGACNVPGNLALNPSFEVASDVSVVNWPASFKSKVGGAHDCERYVEWRMSEDFELASQMYVPLGGEAPAGTVFELAVWVKSLDGNTAPLNLYFEGAKDDYSQKQTTAITAEWTHVGASFTLTKPTSEATIAFRVGGPGKRAFAFDLVTLIRKS